MSKDLLSKLKRSTQEQYLIQDEILRGDYGAPEEHFMTTQKLAQLRGVSVVTAHNIMTGLCEAGYIELRGKKYYLSYSKLVEDFNAQTKIIGLIVPAINNEFYASIAKAVIKLAGQKGYRVLVMDTAYSSAEERAVHKLLLHLKVVGIISCAPTSPENLKLYRECPVACVLLTHSMDDSHKSSVQVNSFPVSQKIAQHLIDQGYRNFLYIGTKNIPLDSDVRYIAFHTELNREGFSLDKKNIFLLSQNDKSDTKALATLLKNQTGPVGVFCYHDLIAAQLYRICHKLGKKIPEDVGIVGFDDLPIAVSLSPQLTTVRYRITTMVDMALKLLFENMKNLNCPYDNYYIEPSFIVRESTNLADIVKSS